MYKQKTPWFASDVFTTTLIIMMLATWAVMGYVAYNAATDPASLGRIVGEIVSGFNEKVK
jgi:hypothetical protein